MNAHVEPETVEAPLAPQGECTIHIVTEIDAFMPYFGEAIQKGCEISGGELSAGYLWTEVRAGHAFALVAIDSAQVPWGLVILRFEHWATGPHVRALGMGGSHMKHWWPAMNAEIKRRGRQAGCVGFIDQGREGLKKFFKDEPGFEILGIVYKVAL